MYDASSNFLNVHEWAYGLTEIVHIASLALSIGTIALVDLRLLGAGLRSTSAEDLSRQLAPWTMVGLILVIVSGFMVFLTDPLRYGTHPTFQLKMGLLVFAIVYHYTARRTATKPGATPGLASLVAVGSLAVWISIVF